MRYITLSLFSLLLSTATATAQARLQRCIVFTFESTYKITMHGKETYYWIIPVDSLAGRKNLSPLLGDSFSGNTLDACCKGQPIAPSVSTKSWYPLPANHSVSLDSLGKLVKKNRKRIQLVQKKWRSGQAQKLEVFATPIEGIFCSAPYNWQLDRGTGYKGLIYIPLQKFSSFNGFWLLPEAKMVERDFSMLDFDAFQNLGRAPWGK